MASKLYVDGVTLIDAASMNDIDKTAYQTLSAVSGTNTIVGTGPSSLTAYASGNVVEFTPAATNTGATTLNISSIGAKAIFSNGAACVGGELVISVPVRVKYDGTQFNIIGGLTTGGILDISAGTRGQIKFPATQNASANANTLDDYEEGTWTPIVGGTATYTTQAGSYTKVGNRVHISCNIVINTIGSGSTGTVSGLPFACVQVSGTNSDSIPCSFWSGLVGTAVFLAFVPIGSTLQSTGAAAATGTMSTPANIFTNSTNVTMGGTYGV